MHSTYTVEYVSSVNEKTIITLNKNCEPEHASLKYVVIDGKKYKFSLTHSEAIIVVEAPAAINDKEIFFCD